jgi:hypothetical protein
LTFNGDELFSSVASNLNLRRYTKGEYAGYVLGLYPEVGLGG